MLAVIAYNQPVTRAFIEQVRGVDSSGVVNSLIEKSLIERRVGSICPDGRLPTARRPDFLRCFGLESLDKLPALPSTDEDAPPDDVLEGQVAFGELEETGPV